MGKLREECGVFGFYDNDNFGAAHITYMGLFALQHRGQESCGIAVNDDGVIHQHKDMGLVSEVFTSDVLNRLTGTIAVGHVRYSTTGTSNRENAQPIVSKYIKGTLTMAHNGNLVNANELREELMREGTIFQTSNDTEVIMHLVAKARVKHRAIEDAVSSIMPRLEGAYSLVLMSPRKLIGVRDPLGFRPLCLGKMKNSYVLASESCAFDTIKAEFIRDIEPGEVVVIDRDGVRSIRDNCKGQNNICIFEYIYFARPDSVIDGISVYEARKRAGRILARTYPVDADMIIGVPDSGLNAAIGYAEESRIPYGDGLIKNRYIGRTFIQPTQTMREQSVNIKLNALSASLKGKRVVLVDDSIVRGTTSAKLIKMIKDAGATEVHLRISAPEFVWPCYFGTDIPSKEDLISCNNTVEEIRQMIGADSLGFLPIEALGKLCEGGPSGFCDACFTGNYACKVPEKMDKLRFE